MRKLKLFLVMLTFVFSSIALTACGVEVKLTAESAIVIPGGSIQLEATVVGQETTKEDFDYEIISGETFASVSQSGLLTINGNAIPDSVVKVQCEYDGTKSNILEIAVGKIPATAIALTVGNDLTTITVEPGDTVDLDVEVTPANSTDKDVTFEVTTDNSNLVSIFNADKKLLVKNSAPEGEVIKVRAKVGSIYSEEVTIVVGEAKTALKQIVVEDEITLDVNALNEKVFTPQLFDGNGVEDESATFDVRVIEGSEYLSVRDSENDKDFKFNILGHGSAKLEVKVIGKSYASAIVDVNTIVPPSQIKLPNYLEAFEVNSENLYKVGATSSVNEQYLPFVPTAENLDEYSGGVCQDLKVEIKKVTEDDYSNSSSNGSYVDGRLYFNCTGTYDIKVTSNSGSRVEESTTYQVEVNNLKNVYNYEQLKQAMLGKQSVNIIVSQKAVYKNSSYVSADDGFNLVPEFLTEGAWESEAQLFNLANQARIHMELNANNSTITINGNGHRIDLSAMPYISSTTANEQNNLGALIIIDTQYITDENGNILETRVGDNETLIEYKVGEEVVYDTTKYFVRINDLSLVGSCGVNSLGAEVDANAMTDSDYYAGFYNRALQINSDRKLKQLNVQIENVEISGFNVGFRICGAKSVNDLNSYMKNIKVDNMFKTGMELCANIMTISNSTFGYCGEGPMEVTPDASKYTGNDFKQTQQISISNITLTPEAVSHYSTPFFKYYSNKKINGTPIIDVLAGALINNNENQDSLAKQLALYLVSQGQEQAVAQQVANTVATFIQQCVLTQTDSNPNDEIDDSGRVGFVGLVLGSSKVNSSTILSSEVFDATGENEISEQQIMGLIQALQTNPATAKITQKYVKISLGDFGYAYLLNHTYEEPTA